MFGCRPGWSIITVLLLTLPAAGKDWPIGRGPAQDPEKYRYDPATWKDVPKEFLDDAPACYLRSSTTYTIEADGTIDTTTHEVIRLNSRKAVEQLGEHRNISFDPAYEKLTLNDARVHKADGRLVEVEALHVQLRDVQTDFLVFDTSKQLIISFPSLEVGDVLDVRWTIHGKNPEHEGQFFTSYWFGDEKYPVYQDRLRVRCSDKKTLKYAPVNPALLEGGKLESKVEKSDGYVTYTWQQSNRKPLPQEDHMPSKEEWRTGVVCSTFSSWDEVASWSRKSRTFCWECNPDLHKVIAEVTKDLDTPLAKAKALANWVRKNVRYVSMGERHDFTPHTPGVILTNRFGDCKDGAQFLSAMLKVVGIPSGFVSLNTRGEGQTIEEVPTPAANHAILLVTLDGFDHWIDTTYSFADWDFLPPADCDRVCYVVNDKSVRVMRTPKFFSDSNYVELETDIELTAKGVGHAVRRAAYYGLSAVNKRDDWVGVPSGERRKGIVSDLQDMVAGSRLRKFDIDEKSLVDVSSPVRVKLEFELPNMLKAGSDGAGLSGSLIEPLTWTAMLGVTADPERSQPLELSNLCAIKHRFHIRAPLGYRLTDVPKVESINSKWGYFDRTVEVEEDGRGWVVTMKARLDCLRIEKADLDAFQRFQDEVQKYYRFYITLTNADDSTGAEDDFKILEALTKIAPGNTETSLEYIREALARGQKEDAAIALRAAIACHPDSMELLDLTPEAAGTLKEVEAAYRKLIEHSPDEPRYRITLARRLLEAKEYRKADDVLAPERSQSGSRKAEAFLLTARILLARQQSKKAQEAFDTAEEADPAIATRGDTPILEGEIQEAQKNPALAEAAYLKALLSGDNASALEGLLLHCLGGESETRPSL